MIPPAPRPETTAPAPARPARGLAAATLLAAVVLSLGAPPAGAAPAAEVPAFEHVIVIVMENKSVDRALDPGTCPFTAQLAKTWVWFSESYAITHPSQPNYIALWAGSTLGVSDNSCPARRSPFDAENFGHALQSAGKTWRAYSEELPAAGSSVCRARGSLYTRKHAPWTQFKNLTHQNERPYSDLAGDIAGHALPDLAFVVPNNCHNTHDCSLSAGDAWLASELPAMLPAVGPRGLVVLTWDEDDHSADNRILTVFAGPLVTPGATSARRISHYTLVRTLCDGLGIPAFGEAAAETAITDVWRRAAPSAEPSKP